VRRRLYARNLPRQQAELALDDEARQHARVLRLAVGDELRLFDAAGHEADARVVVCDRRAIVCEVQPAQHMPEPAGKLQLAVCVPKAAGLELIVRAVTELGVRGITLVSSERSVPKWEADASKLQRLTRIAIEACAQSEQAYAPVISGPMPLVAAVAGVAPEAWKCAFIERTRPEMRLPALLPLLPGQPREVWAVIGPEGGFAPSELALLRQHGFIGISLGSSILRVETACIAACALLLDRCAR